MYLSCFCQKLCSFDKWLHKKYNNTGLCITSFNIYFEPVFFSLAQGHSAECNNCPSGTITVPQPLAWIKMSNMRHSCPVVSFLAFVVALCCCTFKHIIYSTQYDTTLKHITSERDDFETETESVLPSLPRVLTQSHICVTWLCEMKFLHYLQSWMQNSEKKSKPQEQQSYDMIPRLMKTG